MTETNDECIQRQLAQQSTPPLPRFDNLSPENNPYINNPNHYTQYDFDMRRKAEILKYNSNKMSTQTNSLTKRERYALLMKGAIPSRKTPESVCPMIMTPSTASGIPGPAIYLYEDPSVNLYNYATGNRSYAYSVETNPEPWTLIPVVDVSLNPVSKTHLAYLKIGPAIDQSRTTYAVQVPIGVVFSGFSQNVLSHNVTIPYLTLNIYYNATVIQSVTSMYPLNLTFRSTGVGKTFSVTAYLGIAEFQNIPLYTVPEYVYKLEIVLPTTATKVDTVYSGISRIQYYANTTIQSVTANNCNVLYSAGGVNPGLGIMEQ